MRSICALLLRAGLLGFRYAGRVHTVQRRWAWRLPPQIPFGEALRLSSEWHARLHGRRAAEWKHEIIEIAGRVILDDGIRNISALSSADDPDLAEANPGVYAISERDRMLYIGHTDTCLRRRLRNHHVICLDERQIGNPGSLMLDPSDVVRFYCCRDARTAQQLEAAMIDWFSPVFNDRWW